MNLQIIDNQPYLENITTRTKWLINHAHQLLLYVFTLYG